MWRELHYALRLLGKTPGFTALTVFVLAAGLGVAVYMSALIRTLAYAELPFPDQDRLVVVGEIFNGSEGVGNSFNGYDYQQMAGEQTQFEVFIRSRRSDVTLRAERLPTRIRANYSDHRLFDLTAVPALRGRHLQVADVEPGAPAVVVLGYEVWQSEFNGEDAAIGRTVQIDDLPVTVVGVMPAGYAFPDTAQLWLPLPELGVLQPGDGPHAGIIGKLRSGASLAVADAELKAVALRLEQQHPETNANTSVRVWPFSQQLMVNSEQIVAVMAAAAGFILLLVVLNAGNLLLARAAERQKEIAIRTALGAPRWRLVREMLWEAILLALAGGMIGAFFASWALHWSDQAISSFSSLPFWWRLSLGPSDLAYALALSLLTALAVGLYPALRASAGDTSAFLRDGTRGAQGLRMARMTHGLVVAEIALSIALLIVALTLVLSTQNTMQADYGARTDQVLIGEVDLYTQDYDVDPAQRWRFADQLAERLGAAPGVQKVAMGCHLPGMYGPIWTYLVEGSEVQDKRYPTATRVVISDDYFTLFEIPLIQGRSFTPADTEASERVVMISQGFAAANWPGQSPIGKRIGLDRDHDPDNEKWYTVIGVVGEAVYGQPYHDNAKHSDLYLSLRQLPVEDLVVAVATEGEPMAWQRELSREVAGIDGSIPVHEVMSLRERIYRYNAGLIFVSKLFLAIAGLGVLLAASGIYGVIARSVLLRTQELGVRRALGASEQSVLWLLGRQSGMRFAGGAAVGLLLGLLLNRALISVLYGVENQLTLIAMAVVLLVAAIVAAATLLPARWAVSLSPACALRYE